MKRIGLLGCGAIGTQIALAIDSGKIPAILTHVYDIDRSKADSLVSKLKKKPEIVANSHLLSSNPIDLVVEAASQDAVRKDAVSILQNKKDLIIMSAGALLDEAIFEVISDACNDFGKTVYLPTGAIAGLDALKAVKDELESVVLVTTKNPASLKSAPFFDGSDIDHDKSVLHCASRKYIAAVGIVSWSRFLSYNSLCCQHFIYVHIQYRYNKSLDRGFRRRYIK